MTEVITISKNCQGIKPTYETTIVNDIINGVDKTTHDLPFNNLDLAEADKCAVNKIELVNNENSEVVRLSSTCENALRCNKVDINHLGPGSYKFAARATLTDGTTVFTS